MSFVESVVHLPKVKFMSEISWIYEKKRLIFSTVESGLEKAEKGFNSVVFGKTRIETFVISHKISLVPYVHFHSN